MQLFYSGLSDVGNSRSRNEDYHFAGKIGLDEYLFIVADGMGGHSSGEVASRKAVTLVLQKMERIQAQGIPEQLKQIMQAVNDALYLEGKKLPGPGGMGTTLSVLYIRSDTAYITHVGDSRIYLYSNTCNDTLSEDSGLAAPDNDRLAGTERDMTETRPEQTLKLRQLTEDHSFVGKLLKEGLITEEEARTHPRRNVIYQSIGLKPTINIQVLPPLQLKKGQKFLLCSDGLYSVVDDYEISRFLDGASSTTAARQLVKRANMNGGPDNISVIIVSTKKGRHEPIVDELEDTLKIPVIDLGTGRGQRNKTKFVLLGLIILLLLTVTYLLISTALIKH